MKNVMALEGGYKAVIAYNPEMEMFRGEFVGLNGGRLLCCLSQYPAP